MLWSIWMSRFIRFLPELKDVVRQKILFPLIQKECSLICTEKLAINL